MGALLSEPVTAMAIDRSASPGWNAACVTMQGWRRTHEDAHIFNPAAGGAVPAGVFAILDGHGGHIAAQIGAEVLEDRLVRLAQKGVLTPDLAAKLLREAFFDADERLRERLPDEDKSGSTVVAAIITEICPGEYCIQMAHAGDSRAVVCTGGSLVCSEDHKPQRPDETRRIRAAGGTVEHGALGGGPLRVDGTLAVSRSLGDFHFKPKNKAPADCKVTALPETATIRCRAGDWLLLACDGIFDVVTNEEVREFVNFRLQRAEAAATSAEDNTGASASALRREPADGGRIMVELLQLCLDRGSKDNCTACLVQLVPGGAERPRRRELLQGPWARAAFEVRSKYAEFFQSHGFEAEARAVLNSTPSGERDSSGSNGAVGGPGGRQHTWRDSTVSAPAGSGRSPLGGGASNSNQAGARHLAALAKALQAMRSTRAIQNAWRARRDGTDGRGSGGVS